jgi:hypothetical protein
MDTTPTPRTDKAAYYMGREGPDRDGERWCDLLNESRAIERDLTAATEQRDEARERADTMFAKHVDILDQARRERDEARAESIRWMSIAEGRGRTDDEEQLTTVTAQRDRLAEALRPFSRMMGGHTFLGYDLVKKATEALQSLTPNEL